MATTSIETLPLDTLNALTARHARTEASRFQEFLKNLPERNWLDPSFCSDWTIKDIAEHQAAQGALFVDMARAALNGSDDLMFSPQRISQYLSGLQDLNRLELADRLAETSYELYDMLEQASPEQLYQTARTPFGSRPITTLGSFRLSELSLHSWDVRVARDLTAKVSRESLPLLLPGLIAFLPGLVHDETLAQTAPTTYQFEISGPLQTPLALQINPGQLTTQLDYADKPDVIIKLDGDNFLRLAWGRLDLDWMIRDGWVKIEGDTDKALQLNRLFQGI